MNRRTQKISLHLILPALCACALLVIAIRTPAHGYVPFMRNETPACWDLASLPNGQINWRVSADAPAILRESVAKAAEQWSRATDGTLSFAEGPGGIDFIWSTDPAQLPDALYLASTTFNLNGNFNITSARVIVNAFNYDWHCGAPYGVGLAGASGKREVDLDAVILHELGHALGLDHADKNLAALVGNADSQNLPTMNAIVFPGAESLHTDDIVGARSIYLHDTTIPEPVLAISGSPAKGPRPLNVGFAQNLGDETTTWDFGDGHAFTGSAPSHKYTVAGVYTVTATFQGKSTTMTVEVEKKKAKPARVKKVKAKKNQAAS